MSCWNRKSVIRNCKDAGGLMNNEWSMQSLLCEEAGFTWEYVNFVYKPYNHLISTHFSWGLAKFSEFGVLKSSSKNQPKSICVVVFLDIVYKMLGEAWFFNFCTVVVFLDTSYNMFHLASFFAVYTEIFWFAVKKCLSNV